MQNYRELHNWKIKIEANQQDPTQKCFDLVQIWLWFPWPKTWNKMCNGLRYSNLRKNSLNKLISHSPRGTVHALRLHSDCFLLWSNPSTERNCPMAKEVAAREPHRGVSHRKKIVRSTPRPSQPTRSVCWTSDGDALSWTLAACLWWHGTSRKRKQ